MWRDDLTNFTDFNAPHSVICQLSITEICAMFVLDMFQGMIMVTMRLTTEKMMEYNLSWFDVAYTV